VPESTTETQQESGFIGQWRHRGAALRHLFSVFGIIREHNAGFAAVGLLLRIAAATLPLALLATSRIIVDGVTAVSQGHPLKARFWWWVVLEVALATLAALLGRANWYVDNILGHRFSHNLSVRVMEHAARLDLAQYEDAAFHDKLERARLQATDRVPLVAALGLAIQQTVTAASLCIGILWFSPWLLAILTLCLVPAFAGESHFAFLGYSLANRQTPARRQLDYLRFLGASNESAKEMKLFSLADFLAGQFRGLSERLFSESRALWRRNLLTGLALSLFTTAGYYGGWVFVIWRAVHGAISVGTMTFLSGSIAGATSSLQGVFSTFSNIADQSLFLTDVADFFEVRPALPVSPNPVPVPRPFREGFRFEDVSFRYPGSDRTILENFNFHIAPGEHVALVGENGEGKTTIVKLLTRLYDPTAGRILLDGTDLREYDPQSLFREFSVLFQDFMRYDMDAENNIAIGRTDLAGAERESRVAEAATHSGAREVIDRLPAGMNQMLGRRFEGGVELSGGEWQKIAIARAWLREARIFVLDEPTAALDARAELEVFERFIELTRGKMAVLISHRFSTVKMADRIVVIKDGRVAEEGNHEELIARGQLYSSLFELQAASYR
jgi:ATP-binding cassette subfamily B protein